MIKNKYQTKLFSENISYKPYDYPELLQLWKQQHAVHWMADSINFSQDVIDFKNPENAKEVEAIKYILKIFVELDVAVGGNFIDNMLPTFKHNEARVMLTSFLDIETIHQDAYAKLIEVFGLGDNFYTQYKGDIDLLAKYEFINNLETIDLSRFNLSPRDTEIWSTMYATLFSMVITEGYMLYSAFAFLLVFRESGKFKNMGNVVEYSVRDENIHTTGELQLLKIFAQEGSLATKNSEEDTKEYAEIWLHLYTQLTEASVQAEQIEKVFLKNIYSYLDEDSPILKTMPREVIENYMTDLMTDNLNKVRQQIARVLNYTETSLHGQALLHPIDYGRVSRLLHVSPHTNFHEAKPTGYTAGSVQGNFDNAVF